MRKKLNLQQLIDENKVEILLNKDEIEKIEEKIEEKHYKRLISNVEK